MVYAAWSLERDQVAKCQPMTHEAHNCRCIQLVHQVHCKLSYFGMLLTSFVLHSLIIIISQDYVWNRTGRRQCWPSSLTYINPQYIKQGYSQNPTALQWRHNGRDGVSNLQPHHCLLNRLFRRRSKKAPKLCVTGLSEGNCPVAGGFRAQMTSNAKNVSI